MSNYVETELGNLPGAWKVMTVEELVQDEVLSKPLDGNHGNIHPKGTDFLNEGIPFIMASDVKNGKVDLVNCKFISKEQADSLQKGFSKIGDVLLTHKASLGRTAIVQENPYPYIMLTPQVTYYRVLDPNRLNNKYLKYYFDSPIFQDTLVNHGDSGSTRSYVGITAQRELPVIYPPIEIQSSMSQTLGSLDDKIDLLHRQNETLEQMAETLFRQWFVENPNPEWEERPLSEFGQIICGKTPSKKKPEYFDGEYPFIKIPDMHGKTFVFDTQDSLSEEGFLSQEKKALPAKSINVSCIATVGLVTMNAFPSQTNQQINSIITDDEYRYYLYCEMKNSYDLLHAMASGGTATLNLNTGNFSKIPVLQPDEATLDRFNEFVSPMFDKIFENQTQIRTLTALRDTLLPKLMSGEVRVSESTLEKI